MRFAAFIGFAAVSSFTATVAFALAAGVGSALFRPVVRAALPELVTEEQRSAATAPYGAIISFGVTAGPALTALALLVSTPQFVARTHTDSPSTAGSDGNSALRRVAGRLVLRYHKPAVGPSVVAPDDLHNSR